MCIDCMEWPCVCHNKRDGRDEPLYYCDMCDMGIYSGDSYFTIGDEKICERCIDESRVDAAY